MEDSPLVDKPIFGTRQQLETIKTSYFQSAGIANPTITLNPNKKTY
jgi:hypothetical protein